MNFKNFDKIRINQNEINDLLEWRDKNKTFVRNYRSVLDVGLIELCDKPKFGWIYFKSVENLIYLQFFNKDLNSNNIDLVCEVDFIRREDKMFDRRRIKVNKMLETSSSRGFADNSKDNDWEILGQGLLTIYCSIMAYMTYFSAEFVETDEPIKYKESRMKKITRSAKYNPNHKVKLNNKIYTFSEKPKFKNITPKMYNKHIDAWGVRGHIRRLKDKTIWIKPYQKGKGKVSNKVYEFKI